MTVEKEHPSPAVIFTGTFEPIVWLSPVRFPGSPDVHGATVSRIHGQLGPRSRSLDALIGPFRGPDRAVIVAIDDISCTAVGDKEYLAFTARVKFAR